MFTADPITAFILCGGLGTRLRPVLADRPKSMAPVAGVPFLQLLILYLRAQGIEQIILGTGYMAEAIESYFGDGQQLGVEIAYSQEETPLGTGGAVRLALPRLSDPLLVLNGDSYADFDLRALEEAMQNHQADGVMLLREVEDVARYGSVTLGPDGRIRQFNEKGVSAGRGLINAGVYLLRRDLISHLPVGNVISLERDLFPALLDKRFYGRTASGLFIDIGIPQDLARAQTLLADAASHSV